MTQRRVQLLVLFFLAGALPAHANNPPQPDGLFAMLLVFPVVIVAMRIASVSTPPKRPVVRIIGTVAAGIVVLFFLGAGTAMGALAAVGVVIYAAVRCGRMLDRSSHPKRWWIAGAVLVLSLMALADYWFSIVRYYPSTDLYEVWAASGLRSLANAESEFALREKGVGNLQQLREAALIDDSFLDGHIRKGYRYGEFVDSDGKDYIFYAIPAEGLPLAKPLHDLVPGTSLIKALVGAPEEGGTGERSLAIDQTDVVRAAIRKKTGVVTREEILEWPPLQ